MAEENKRLRAENGELLQGLNKEMQALQLENSRLQAQLERAERDLAAARLAATDAVKVTAPAVPSSEAAPEDELVDLNPNENIFELQIVLAELTVGPQVTTFFTLDFFDHATQVRPLPLPIVSPCADAQGGLQPQHGLQVSTQQLGPNPKYSSTVQFVVPMSEALFRYMATSTLKLELNQLLSSDWAQVGRATLPLAEVLKACQQASAPDQHVRNLRIHGPGGTSMGTVRVRGRAPSRLVSSLAPAAIARQRCGTCAGAVPHGQAYPVRLTAPGRHGPPDVGAAGGHAVPVCAARQAAPGGCGRPAGHGPELHQSAGCRRIQHAALCSLPVPGSPAAC